MSRCHFFSAVFFFHRFVKDSETMPIFRFFWRHHVLYKNGNAGRTVAIRATCRRTERIFPRYISFIIRFLIAFSEQLSIAFHINSLVLYRTLIHLSRCFSARKLSIVLWNIYRPIWILFMIVQHQNDYWSISGKINISFCLSISWNHQWIKMEKSLIEIEVELKSWNHRVYIIYHWRNCAGA